MNSSIRLNLLKWLIGPLLAINLIAVGFIYWLAWAPAQIGLDESLADTAWALIPRLRDVSGKVELDLSKQAEEIVRFDHSDAIFFVVRNLSSELIAGDKDFSALQMPSQFNEPLVYDGWIRNEPTRIIVLKTLAGTHPVLIGVAETLRKRNNIRSNILLTLILLESIFTVFSVAIVLLAVSKGLSPLKKMQSDLNARTYDDLSAIDDSNIPSELRPVAAAINNLLQKVQAAAAARQNFLANVAHQLRTPLSGLRTQLDWIQQRHATEVETAHSAKLMMSSTERMIRQTNQLLSLARAEPSQFEKTGMGIVELDKLVEESVQYFVEKAVKKNIDLGFNLRPASVIGSRFLLHDLVDNLLDNAIRYSAPHGTVTVSILTDQDHVTLCFEDSGPGIPPTEREMIFNRFYRLNDKNSGSGLGLAIVRDIANDHNAKITLNSGPNGNGTIFSVLFPLTKMNGPG